MKLQALDYWTAIKKRGYGDAMLIFCMAMLYFVVAHYSLRLSFPGSNASPVWPPSGIAVAAVLLLGYRILPAVFLGAFAANVAAFTANADISVGFLLMSVGIAIGNSAEAFIASFLLRYMIVGKAKFANPEDVFRFMGVVLLASAISAGLGTANLVLGGVVTQQQAIVFLNWWLGDLAGMMVITPLLLAWLSRDEIKHSEIEPMPRYGIKQLMSIVCFTALCWIVLHDVMALGAMSRLLMYLVIPAIALIAFFHSLRMVSLAIFIAACIAIFATLHGSGPFTLGDSNSSLIVLVSFLAIYALTGLVLAADRAQRANNVALENSNKAYSLISWATLLVFLAITFIVWHFSVLEAEASAKNKFEFMTQEIKTRVNETIGRYRQMLSSGVALFAASEEVSRQEWQAFYSKLSLDEYPGVLGFAYGQWLEQDKKQDYLNAIRNEGMDTFKIFPAGERDVYVPVTYYEPLSLRSQRAIGFDMYSEPLRRAAMLKARDTAQATITPKLEILFGDAHDSKVGFIMYTPLFKSYFVPGLAESRHRLIKGFVYTVFLMPELMDGMLGNHNKYVAMQIFDQATVEGATKVYDKTTEMYRSDNWKQLVEQPSRHALALASPLYVQDRQWTLIFTALPGFDELTDRQKPQLILIGGLLFSLLFFMLVRVLANTRETAMAIANEMTSALRLSEAKTRSLTETANEAIIVNDSQGRIISWNRAAVDLFGYQEADILGQDFGKLIPAEYRAIYLDMLSPHQHSPGNAANTTEIWAQSQIGIKFPIEISFSSWQDGPQFFYGIIIRDIRFRKYAEESLRASEAKFRSTLEHAPIGMAIVSLIGRWTDVNRALCTMLGYTHQELGALTFQDITHPDDLEVDMEKVNALLQGSISSYQIEKRYFKKTGEIVWVLLTATLMRNEKNEAMYFIAQIEDISDKKQAETRLRENLIFTSAILSSASQAIIAVNTEGIILSFNEAAEKMLQYSRDEVLGKHTPNLFHDEHEVRAHAAMLSAELGYPVQLGQEVFVVKALAHGSDTNDWIYIRKDGSRFPVALTITALRNEHGEVTGYLGVAADISDRKQKEEISRQSLAEKETLLKEVYHRVKNNMQVITSLFNIQLRDLPEGAARESLLQASQRVVAMSLVHEKLYQSKNLDSILLDIYIRELCQQLTMSYGMEDRNIDIQLELEPVTIRLDKAVPLGLILNELITNSLKHAFPHGGKGQIHIHLTRLAGVANGQIQLVVADDGVGSKGADDKEYSLGIKLVHILASQLDATLTFSHEQGTQITMTWQAALEPG